MNQNLSVNSITKFILIYGIRLKIHSRPFTNRGDVSFESYARFFIQIFRIELIKKKYLKVKAK